MKQAIILVGSNHAGKSKIINIYLKPKLGIDVNSHIFELKGNDGFILSQSFEDDVRDVGYAISKYADQYDYLVLACRPETEAVSCLSETMETLSNVGFNVHTVIINLGNEENYYNDKSREIFRYLNG